MRPSLRTLTALALAALSAPGLAQCELGKLLASNGAGGDAFGSALAVEGLVAVVGAPYAGDLGAAYVFERQAGGWTEVAVLSAADGAPGDLFGAAVDVSGATVLVGAPGKSGAGLGAGAAYAFERQGSTWVPTFKLTAPAPQPGARFGAALSVWFDFALVGAPGTALARGATHSFVRSGTSWTALQELAAPGGQPGDEFGFALALDGSTAAIGAPGDDAAARDGGALHVWQQGAVMFFPAAVLTASDPQAYAGLGWSVALEGTTLVGGAPFATGVGGLSSGAAYVYDDPGAGWGPTAKLSALDGLAADGCGAAVALSGAAVLLGAPQNLTALGDKGRAYAFQRGGSGWAQTGTLAASDGQTFDHFGGAVGLALGESLVGAAFGDDAGLESGAVYRFARAGAPTVYCTAKVTSSGCLPSISASGRPSASGAGDFTLHASAVQPGNMGLFFYGTSGLASVPFQGGFLCSLPPLTRTPAQPSIGLAACTGLFVFDFDGWVASGADPALVAGADVSGQFWFRDPPHPLGGSGLTNAIAFTLCQ